jgi:hypothetical protein
VVSAGAIQAGAAGDAPGRLQEDATDHPTGRRASYLKSIAQAAGDQPR